MEIPDICWDFRVAAVIATHQPSQAVARRWPDLRREGSRWLVRGPRLDVCARTRMGGLQGVMVVWCEHRYSLRTTTAGKPQAADSGSSSSGMGTTSAPPRIGTQALELFAQEPSDVVQMLDIVMPGLDGVSVPSDRSAVQWTQAESIIEHSDEPHDIEVRDPITCFPSAAAATPPKGAVAPMGRRASCSTRVTTCTTGRFSATCSRRTTPSQPHMATWTYGSAAEPIRARRALGAVRPPHSRSVVTALFSVRCSPSSGAWNRKGTGYASVPRPRAEWTVGQASTRPRCS